MVIAGYGYVDVDGDGDGDASVGSGRRWDVLLDRDRLGIHIKEIFHLVI